MTSKGEQAFVWIWLPGCVEPIVAGKLQSDRDKVFYYYGRSYLERTDAISIYDEAICP